jgi:hypothetical protein
MIVKEKFKSGKLRKIDTADNIMTMWVCEHGTNTETYTDCMMNRNLCGDEHEFRIYLPEVKLRCNMIFHSKMFYEKSDHIKFLGTRLPSVHTGPFYVGYTTSCEVHVIRHSIRIQIMIYTILPKITEIHLLLQNLHSQI